MFEMPSYPKLLMEFCGPLAPLPMNQGPPDDPPVMLQLTVSLINNRF
jgi:hypothetical protein